MFPAIGLAVFVASITIGVLVLEVGAHWWELPIGMAIGGIAACGALVFSRFSGHIAGRILVSGSSTAPANDHSFETALVMQGRIDDALSAFEAVIRDEPNNIGIRIRAAELYIKEHRGYARAEALFRDALSRPSITLRDEIYITHRLVDLYTGPLQAPGKALVDLRRLIERHPQTKLAQDTRQTLATLKERFRTELES